MRRLIGISLILTAIIGLVFSLAGLVGTWYFIADVEEFVGHGIELVHDSLDATAEGLVVTQQALEVMVDSIASLQLITDSAAKALATSQPLLEGIAGVLDNELPSTITGVQNSLTTASESAKLIDGVLGLLSSLPFVNLNYNPEQPLHESLQRVSDDIGKLPDSLSIMETDLSSSVDNLGLVQEGMQSMADSIGEISTSLESYDVVIQQYLDTINELINGLYTLMDNLALIFLILAISLSIFFIWMMFAQIGLLTQGVDLLHGAANQSTPPVEAAEADRESQEPDFLKE